MYCFSSFSSPNRTRNPKAPTKLPSARNTRVNLLSHLNAAVNDGTAAAPLLDRFANLGPSERAIQITGPFTPNHEIEEAQTLLSTLHIWNVPIIPYENLFRAPVPNAVIIFAPIEIANRIDRGVEASHLGDNFRVSVCATGGHELSFDLKDDFPETPEALTAHLVQLGAPQVSEERRSFFPTCLFSLCDSSLAHCPVLASFSQPQPRKLIVRVTNECFVVRFARISYNTEAELDAFRGVMREHGISAIWEREPADAVDLDESDGSSDDDSDYETDEMETDSDEEEEDPHTPEGLIPATNVFGGEGGEEQQLQRSPLLDHVYSQPDGYNFSP